MFHEVGGCFSTKRILTIDLMPLKPYFHGTTRRIGAPFWAGNTSPYSPTERIVSGFMASSIRKPSTYGQSKTAHFSHGNRFGSCSDTKWINFALPVGSANLTSELNGKPTHGITIDHASTQRIL